MQIKCSVPGCGRPVRGRSLCNTHLNRLRKFGDPRVDIPINPNIHGRAPLDIRERFMAKVNQHGPTVRWELGPCWLWTGGVFRDDNWEYGAFYRDNQNHAAHRVSYELFVGPIPEGLNVLHRCDVMLCVRPEHLFPGTQAENMADMVAKGRSLRGVHHPLAKLTEPDVRDIRERFASGTTTKKVLAAEYGVDITAISAVVRRKNWGHVKETPELLYTP